MLPKYNMEKRLGKWQQHMREHKRDNSLSKEKIDALDATIGWRWEEPCPFTTQYENWVSQYKKNGRKPNKRSNNDLEKKAGNWQCIYI